MERQIVYAGQQPTDQTILKMEKSKMLAQGALQQAILGLGTVVDGLSCIPTVPASLAVQLTGGSIYQTENVDTTPYGTLPLDLVNSTIKQGLVFSTTSLTLTPPGTAGQAINYLIQAQLSETDADSTVLPYFNSANPLVPFSGPAGSGTAQPTVRRCSVSLQAKAGTPATAGSQVTPAPDAGWVGLYAVTVANGATALTSGQIAQLSTAPFIPVKLPAVPGWVQGSTWAFGVDTGSANAMVITLNPVPTAYANMSIFVKKMGSANTGAMTANVNGLGSVAIINADGSPLSNGQMAASFAAHLVFDGTSLRFMNGVASASVGALTASSGEGINVNGSAVVALNVPSLTDNPSIGVNDLLPYYNQSDVHHRSIKWSELLTGIFASFPGSLLRITPITANGTWTKGANTKKVLVIATGAGGAGGGQTAAQPWSFPGTGGAAGGTSIAFVDVSAVATVACTIGAGGLGIMGGSGTDGAATSFGTYAAASGGKGGQNSALLAAAGAFNAPAPGTGTAGNVTLDGAPGHLGHNSNVAWAVGGNGGASFWGGGGIGVRYGGGGGVITGGTPSAPGAGGGGGTSGGAGQGTPIQGGNGAPGFILVLEFA